MTRERYPTSVTDQREMAGWMRREREAYEQGRQDAMAGMPPTTWPTMNTEAGELGLWTVVDEALTGKFMPSRRKRLVDNIVIAVARWREQFRDCGCWKTDDGYAACPWHEGMLQEHVKARFAERDR